MTAINKSASALIRIILLLSKLHSNFQLILSIFSFAVVKVIIVLLDCPQSTQQPLRSDAPQFTRS